MNYEEKYKEMKKRVLAIGQGYVKEVDYSSPRSIAEYIDPELRESEDERIRKEIIQSIKNNMCVIHKEKCLDWLEKQSEQGNNEDEAILHRFSFYSYKDEPNILYLAGLYVNDEYRNKGIGTKILKIADEVAVSMKCSSILLKTEIGSNAERLYKNNGYSVFRREENQVWLEKQGEQNTIVKESPSKEMILAVWELGNIWKELTKGSSCTEYGTQLQYIQKHWNESNYYEKLQGEQNSTDEVKPKFKVGDWITIK